MDPKFNAELAGHMALAHAYMVEQMLIALFSIHPEPKTLLKFIEAFAKDHDDYRPFSWISDEAWDYAGSMQSRLREILRERVASGE